MKVHCKQETVLQLWIGSYRVCHLGLAPRSVVTWDTRHTGGTGHLSEDIAGVVVTAGVVYQQVVPDPNTPTISTENNQRNQAGQSMKSAQSIRR